jgi:hypothetical protein
MPRRSLKLKETKLREERITWLWNRRWRWRREVTGQRRGNGSSARRRVHNGRMRDVVGWGGWRWTGDPGWLIGDVVKGEERVSSEGEVVSRRAELFEKATTVFDPGGSLETRFDNGKSKEIWHKWRSRCNCLISYVRRLLIYGRERGKQLNVVVMPKGTRDPHVIWNERLAHRNRLWLRRNGGRGCYGRLPNKLWEKNRLTHPRGWKSRGRGRRSEIDNRVRQVDR